MQLSEVDREESSQEEALEPELPIVDAHHHLWPPGYWIPYDLAALKGDLGRGHRIVATVFVECMTSFRPDGTDEALRPLGETQFIVAAAPAADTASGTTVAAAVVGWADLLAASADVARTLDGHLEVGQGRFRGVRFNVVWHDLHSSAAHAGRQTIPHMLLDERYRASLREIAARGLTYDVWLYHPQLGELADTLDAVSDLTFVVNHLGGPVPHEPTPASRAAVFEAWRGGLREVARRPNVVVKIGGVGMPLYGFGFQNGGRPTSRDLAEVWKPYVEVAVETFGPERCMFESNFPVDKQSFSYDALWNAFKLVTTGFSGHERSLIFEGTARRVYGLEEPAGAKAVADDPSNDGG